MCPVPTRKGAAINMVNTNVHISELMSGYPIVAKENDRVDKLGQLMRRNEIRHVPIVRDDKVVGLVCERDIKVIAGLPPEHRELLQASDIMARDLVTVLETDSIEEVASKMADHKVGSVIVTDQFGKLAGVFTTVDALNTLVEISRASRC